MAMDKYSARDSSKHGANHNIRRAPSALTSSVEFDFNYSL